MHLYTTNPNDDHAFAILKTCYSQGVTVLVICPGSRSTPMAVAAVQAGLRCYTHFDERGAAFFALGIAKGSGKPVGVLTTSGTAVANLLPAVIEAQKSSVPLILLTCDRPPELIWSGANQTIEQGQLLPVARYVLPPTDSHASGMTVAYAVAKAVAERQPAHINIPFREPLSDLPIAYPNYCPAKVYMTPVSPVPLPPEVIKRLSEAVSGVFVVGGGTESAAILQLAEQYGWPLLPDVCSPLRYRQHPLIVAYAEVLATTSQLPAADMVFHVGDPCVGKGMTTWLKNHKGGYIRAHDRPDFGDPLFCAQTILIGPIDIIGLRQLSVRQSAFRIPDKDMSLPIGLPSSEYQVFEAWSSWIPEGAALFLGNSLPIRQIGQVACPVLRDLDVFYNRGASGIDGIVATAGGVAAAQGVTVLILGDLSFLHDLSSLPLVAQTPLLIVVIQNNGGEIFSRFPVSTHPAFPFFHLSHEYAADAAAQWALSEVHRVSIATALPILQKAAVDVMRTQTAVLVEVVVSPEDTRSVENFLRIDRKTQF